ncbi:MAG: ATP-binding cassette domain-containing protein [Marinilabiliaceae bacterium]
MSISIKNVTKRYGAQTALDDVSLEIGDGQILGLLGPNGAGKSTLMRVVTGFVKADAGTVTVCGHDIDKEPLAIRSLTGYLPESNPLNVDMYVREYLTMMASLSGVKDKERVVEELVELTGLTPEAHKRIGSLSKGYKQRVGISQALIGDPKVVILDEPTTGLDPNQIIEIRELIRSLSANRTVILSTHIMQEVEATCDHIVIIDHGKIKASGPVAEVLGLAAEGCQTVDVEFESDIDPERLGHELQAKVEKTGERRFRLTAPSTDDDLRITLFRFATRHNNPLLHLSAKSEDMEDVFHRLTADSDTQEGTKKETK